MAFLRKLGNLSQLLLQSHLKEVERQRESDLVKQRQMEMAKYNDDLRRGQAEDARKQALLQRALDVAGDDSKVAALSRSGIDFGPSVNLTGMLRPEEEIMGGLQAKLSSAKREDLPTDIGIEGMLSATPGRAEMGRDPRLVKDLMTGRDSRRASIEDLVAQTAAEGAAAKQAETFAGEMGKEQANAANFDAQLARKKKEFAAMTPLEADRARREASARVAAEWDPKVVAAKLDLERQKNVMELAQIGLKTEAEASAGRTNAIKGLLPTYTRYRELALSVVNSPAGASSPIAGAAHRVGAAVPYIGGLISQTMEGTHAAAEYLRSPENSKNIAELNRLTDTLAQGMANAVLGNKGQTTENDRMTAKNILVNSFLDKDTAADMIAITDRMFQLLPAMSAQNTSLPAGAIIEAAYNQAKAEASGQASTQPGAPASNPALAAAQQRLQRMRGGR